MGSEANMIQIEEKIGYRDILCQKEYCKKIAGNIINRLGDSIDMIAFTWLVYAVTGSATWTALVYACNQIPSVILQPFAGVMVSGMDKKKVLVVTDLLRGFLVVVLALLYAGNLLNPWMLVIITMWISSAEAFNLPSGMALIPKILNKKYYSFGTSLNSTLCNIAQLIGVGIAGIIIGELGIETAIFIDGITFFLSALITCTIQVETEHHIRQKLCVTEYKTSLIEGFQYIKSQESIFHFCILAVLLNAFFVPLNSLQTPMAIEIYGLGSKLLSVFGMASVMGMGIGTFLLPYIMRYIKVRRLMVTAGIGIGVCYGALTLGKYTYAQSVPSYILCGSIMLLLGICMSWEMGLLNIQFMKNVKEEYLPRAGAIFNAGACAAAPIMSIIISGLTLKLSVASIFILCAISCILIFMYIGLAKINMEN